MTAAEIVNAEPVKVWHLACLAMDDPFARKSYEGTAKLTTQNIQFICKKKKNQKKSKNLEKKKKKYEA